MVMADVTVLTDMWKEEEKRIKELLEKLGQQMKDHGVGQSKVKVERVNCNACVTFWETKEANELKTTGYIRVKQKKSEL